MHVLVFLHSEKALFNLKLKVINSNATIKQLEGCKFDAQDLQSHKRENLWRDEVDCPMTLVCDFGACEPMSYKHGAYNPKAPKIYFFEIFAPPIFFPQFFWKI